MKLLGIDFETTGPSPDTDRVLEIGAVVWDTDRKTPLIVSDCLVKHAPAERITVSETIQKLTGILPADLEKHGKPPAEAFAALGELMSQCDYVVAHNGMKFDQPLYHAEIARLGWKEKAAAWQRPWIDTCVDVPYPDHIRTRALRYLAADHDILNPFPHRAVFDVLTMLSVLSHYDIAEVAEIARSPVAYVRAVVTIDENPRAKERGYLWHSGLKIWFKRTKECWLEKESAGAPFQVVCLTADEVQRLGR